MPLPLARNSQHNGFGEDQLGVRCAAVLMSAWGQTRSFGGVGSMSGLPEGGHGGKARNTSFCAAASRPGSARVHASDNNFGHCGPSPAYGPLHGTCSALLPGVRAMAKIMHGLQNTKRPRG